MRVGLAYDPIVDAYDLGPGHPFRPERVSLAIALIAAYGLTGRGEQLPRDLDPLPFSPCTDRELARAHDADYIAAVRAASRDGAGDAAFGLGPGDTPAFPGVHDAAAAVAGATRAAMDAVAHGTHTRAFAPAGGLHHAHRARAAGFCVYNDVAVAIASALEGDPSLTVAYLDIDAHHGDGVQEAFYGEPRVLTVSIHEDGRYLYPGTGAYRERGAGAAAGTALNLPMPPYADDRCYAAAFERVVEPAIRAFGPRLLVTQNGADAHWSDPLTHLGLTIDGFDALFGRITRLADEVCQGRIVACGGGGYSWRAVVPRVWTLLAASLTGTTLPEALPNAWRDRVPPDDGEPPSGLHEDAGPGLSAETRAMVHRDTDAMLDRVAELVARV